MKAVVYSESLPIDHPEALREVDMPEPTPGAQDLLVGVEAISVNPVDYKIRLGRPPEGPTILGWDAVGRVEALGASVAGFEVGQRVWYAGDLKRPGSNAERQAVDHRIVSLAPTSLAPGEAAALPLTAITAWELLFERLGIPQGKAPRGDVLLISGAAGGVGSILVQMAARLTAATVVVTAGRPESRDWLRSLGAHHVISYREPLGPQLKALGLSAVTHIASLTHTGDYLPQFVDILAPFGHLALIDDPESLDVSAMKGKSLSLHWEFMFTRSSFETWDMSAQGRLLGEVAALVDSGVLRSTLQQSLGAINAENLRKAHGILEGGGARGKIVLSGF